MLSSMEKKRVRWGVIGAGDVVERKSGRPLADLPGSEWMGLTRRSRGAAEEIARRFGVPRVYADAEELLADGDIDAVYVATPPSTHAVYAVAALEAGKDVYLEKPMAMDLSEAREIADAVSRTGRKLVMAHYRRALPAFEEAGRLIASGAVGTVRFARIRVIQPADSEMIASSETPWRLDPAVSGGGLFHDLAPHQLDLMHAWFGRMESGHGSARSISGSGTADDYVSGGLRFESGVEFDGLWAFCADSADRAEEGCAVYGDSGRLRFSFYGDSLELADAEGTKRCSFENPRWIQEPMIRRVVGHFLGKEPNPCPVEAGVETMKMMATLTGRT